MKKRDTGFLILGFVVALLLVFVPKLFFSPKAERAPALAGQQVPNESFRIDFAKRYSIGISEGFNKAGRLYENVRIVGYTGRGADSDAGGGSLSKYGHFDDWLVIELADKRRAYLPLRSVEYLEEAVQAK